MKNKYLTNLNKLEFILTYACTGKCKHCSEGDHEPCAESINAVFACDAVRRISAEYDIKTVMVFGGEPLLHIDAASQIISAAREMNIPKRQIITNGYFSKSEEKIYEAANRLYECGVNDLLLSADSFHQEAIPIETVKLFAKAAIERGLKIRLSPAWLVGRDADNEYNIKTREIISEFEAMNIPLGEGNVVFPEGNAKKYLSEYFLDNSPENPYTEDPCNVKCISFEPNGTALGGNFYKNDVMEIIERYNGK